MFEEITESDDDRQSIYEFICQVNRLIFAIAFERYLDKFDYTDGAPIVFEGDDLALYQDAVSEYQNSGDIDYLLRMVLDAPLELLAMHGLLGRQLRMKRVMVWRNEQRFVEHPRGRIFRKFLQAIDVLLDSILTGLPAGTALKELKEAAGLLPRTEPTDH